MKYLWGFVSLALAIAAPLFAQDAELKRGPAPDWAVESGMLAVPDDAQGAVFVRRRDEIVHLDADGSRSFSSFRIHILQPSALQLGNLAIAWNPAAGEPVIHRLLIHRGSAAIDVLGNNSFEILRREDQLEQAALNGVLTASLRVPDLRVGDELELAFTVPANDPTFGATSFGILAMADQMPQGRYNLRLSWEEGQKPRLLPSADWKDDLTEGERAINIAIDDPEAVSAPRDAPPRYSWLRAVEYSDFESWQQVSREFATLFSQAEELAPDSDVRKEAARIASEHPDAHGRAKAALKLVQRQVRYVYVGLNGGNFRPASADETWSRRYGDCKAKTALLLALLRELGVPAEAALVNNSGGDDGLETHLPAPTMFDHVLVRANIDGKTLWMDGTMPPVVAPSDQPVLPYRWALPLDPDGAGLTEVAWTVPEHPDEIWLFEIDAREGFDEPANIAQTRILRGADGVAMYAQLGSLSPAQLEAGIRQTYEGTEGWDAVKEVRYAYDEDAQASILVIRGTGPVDWEENHLDERSLALPGGGFNPPSRRQRPAGSPDDVPYYSAPEFDCSVTTVRLPKSSEPANWTWGSSFVDHMFGRLYSRQFGMRDGSLRMIRTSRVEQPELEPSQAEKDNARIDSFDNSKAYIYYDGQSTALYEKGGTSVPATYDHDWVHNAEACLPPAVRK